MSGLTAGAALPPRLALPPGLRVYAIGDIHGRFDLLSAVAEEIRRDIERARPVQSLEIFLGDYVDRGPQSCEVIEWLTSTPPIADRRICLTGNHEDMLLRALDDPGAMAHWLSNGGGETLLSYRATGSLGARGAMPELQQAFREALPERHLAFLASLDLSFAVDPYLFVHAGIRPGRSLSQQDPEDLIWIREPFLRSDDDFGFVVVHGHTPVPSPEVRANRISIDTGAVFTGRLTALVLEGTERRFIEAVASP